MNGNRIRPSRWWYVLAATIAVAVLVCVWVFLFVFLFASWLSVKSDIQRFIVPGTHQFKLPSAGSYVIYHEYRSVVDGVTFSTKRDAIRDLTCRIDAADGTETVMVSSTDPYAKYKYGRREGVSVFIFKIGRPGTYVLTAKYAEGKEGPRIVLAIARKLTERIMPPVLVFGLSASGATLLAAAIFWITFLKRRKAKERLVTK